jgi:glycosyltransferase involved in cell wall biosynthesis
MAPNQQNGRSTCIHVIHSLEYGGAQRDLYYYAKFHDREKYRLEIVSFHPGGEMLPPIEALGLEVHTLGTRSSDPRSITRLVRIFGEHKADIVHFHNSLPVFSGVPAAGLARVPVKVMTEHSIYYPGKAGGSLSTSLYFNLRRRLDMVIACSEEVRESHQPELDPDRTVTIVNGVDLGHFKASDIKTDPVVFNIGSIGSLTVQKGYSNLVQAVKALSDKGVPARLTFVGDGPLRGELEHQAAESGIADIVSFAGTTNDVMSLLPAFDIVAGSSLREGLPLSVLEAMAAGLPVVTTDVGGNREAVIDGVTGLLVPPGDPDALAEALEKLWNDEAKRASMGKAGRLRVEEHFSAKNMVAETEKIYASILGSGSGGTKSDV